MPKGIPNKRYTPEFKVMVVETMRKEKLSYCEAARLFAFKNNFLSSASQKLSAQKSPDLFASFTNPV
ncbi:MULTISPECIES: hypothetical protein [Caproicibacterium]|uniref:Transposase n=1 Tax=Caproicibacterium argilliputei TaxID=3030016 RepID=A0AA97D878_9FIRM|nr:hypothetical protein [Caproicibacterium argilliputei]WOC31282.1 hypothetical protein PXC00_08590 [Caproicibacterium argilliputei]